MFGLVVLSIYGIVFGIGGVRQSGRRHHFAWMGLMANFVLPVFIMLTTFIAMASESGHPNGGINAFSGPGAGYQMSSSELALWWTLVGVLGTIAVYRFGMRSSTKLTPAQIKAAPSKLASCPRCRKQIPMSARFCRRCGCSA